MDTANEVLNSLTEAPVQSDPTLFVSERGLKLRIHKVNKLILMDATKRLKLPSIPMWHNPDKDRLEENPNDPDYLAAVQTAKFDQGMLLYSIFLAYGTSVLELPEGMQAFTETEWSDTLKEVTGIDVPTTGKARYVAWLKFYMLEDNEINDVITYSMRLSGAVKEEDVKEAVDTFRSDA
jgi:hypothetical protein